MRENSITFFGNDKISLNHKTIEITGKGKEAVEKEFKKKLKIKITSNEYQKFKEEQQIDRK